MKTLIIIPTYNEAENISKLIKEIFNFNNQLSVMIVDDNSSDGTAEIIRGLKGVHSNH